MPKPSKRDQLAIAADKGSFRLGHPQCSRSAIACLS